MPKFTLKATDVTAQSVVSLMNWTETRGPEPLREAIVKIVDAMMSGANVTVDIVPTQCNVMFCVSEPHEDTRHVDATGHGWVEDNRDDPEIFRTY